MNAASTLIPAALLVATDQAHGLDDDERMTVLELVQHARNVLRLPEQDAAMGATELDESDADENETTRAYRTILEASDEEIDGIIFDDEFLWQDGNGGSYAVGIIDHDAVLATRGEIVRLALTDWVDFDLPTDEHYQAENPAQDKIFWRAVEGDAHPDHEVWWIDSIAFFVEEIPSETSV